MFILLLILAEQKLIIVMLLLLSLLTLVHGFFSPLLEFEVESWFWELGQWSSELRKSIGKKVGLLETKKSEELKKILCYVLFFSDIWLFSVLPRHVPLKVTRCFAWVTALIAGVGLFSGVSALVSFQTTRLSARIVALITLERFHSWMGTNVSLKMRSQFA